MMDVAQNQGYLPFTEESCKKYLRDNGLDSLVEEINPDGMGHEFCKEELNGR